MTALRPPASRPRPIPVLRGAAVVAALLAVACGEGPEGAGRPEITDVRAERGAFGAVDAALVCAEATRDFGTVWEGTVLEHEFLLEVQGNEAVELRTMRADCGCAVADLEVLGPDGERAPYTYGRPLAPGTRLGLALTFDTRGKRGKVPGSVGIYGNQRGGETKLEIMTEVRPWLVAEPDELQVPTMTVEEARELRFRVRSAVGKSFHLEHVRRAVPDTLQVVAIPVAPDGEGRAEAWDVVVQLGAGMPKGVHVYPIHMASDVENPDARADAEGRRSPYSCIPRLAVEIVGRYRVEPASLDFGHLPPDAIVARSLRITLLDEDFDLKEPAVTLEPLKTEQPFPLARTAHLTVRPVEGQRAWDVQLLLDGIDPEVAPVFLARLVIETGHPVEPELSVAVRGTHHRSVARPPQGD